MLKLHLLTVTIILSVSCLAQIKATTTNGREVILLENGKWYYAGDSSANVAAPDSIVNNNSTFVKNKNADFLLKSGTINIGVYFDRKAWKSSKSKKTEDSEYSFDKLGDDAIAALLITEKTKISFKTLADMALTNAKDTDPQAKVIHREYRMVNGTKVLCQLVAFTSKGIKFVILGYYYSGDAGTVQLVTTALEEQFDTLKPTMEDFLNGFVVL
jgi:hypothetical protein